MVRPDTLAVVMDFTPHPDHEAIRDGVRRVCADFPDEYWRRCDEAHEFPWDFYRAMADGGWVGIAIPEEYGGGGRGITEASIVLEEIAASGAAMNGCSAIHLSIFGMEPVVAHGSEELKQRILPPVAAGELHVAFGVTEPDAGTDTTAIATRAARDEWQSTSSAAARSGPPRRPTATRCCCSSARRRSRSVPAEPTA